MVGADRRVPSIASLIVMHLTRARSAEVDAHVVRPERGDLTEH